MPRTLGDAQPPDESFSLDHFVNLYLAKDDPWDNAFKWSDQRKYAVTMASLPRERYRRGRPPKPARRRRHRERGRNRPAGAAAVPAIARMRAEQARRNRCS
ncbi:hypothetical protein [Actinoplanes sp. RD1]|uniref:hypothetical protein n=1 Tax=Actinoplanes sp. RD1 TaxID=3064538 RepID=UPI002740ADEA|nr:hypothetical protein [Actinoplanes sp. RD1]